MASLAEQASYEPMGQSPAKASEEASEEAGKDAHWREDEDHLKLSCE